jgi:membrane-associated protease RseP (regulator of RpoE activity)
MVMEAFLGFQVGTWDYATSCNTIACVARATMVQQTPKDLCGWVGVRVAPMTKAFAESLGMAETYGAIFDRPEPGSPAESAGIEQGDVLTAINGSPLMQASDFAKIISAMAPGTAVSGGRAVMQRTSPGWLSLDQLGHERRLAAMHGPDCYS